ncbi:sterol desaturase family protein [Winogradskyella eckloniae]|uniref:sterol desaturase family protein n=1 Tax=Winogradskyella eckloniae TaxID=1089306 RepID=UPI0015637AF0|nr:sterol desaturase family protein [Winogradskyella eckloniae]NRD20468.1 sterol desaturase family protein [Winogradskyella eckloniae]
MIDNDIWDIILITALSYLFLSLVFIPMEKVFPAKKGQKIFRPNWFLDFCFFIGQYVIWSSLVLWTINYFGESLSGIIPKKIQSYISFQPLILQTLSVLILSDFLIYCGHRLQHKIDFLWRFHKVHHSAKHLDWLAAHREHPLDSIYTIGLINLPAYILGFPLESIAGIIAFRGIWAIYIHSNVRLPLGPLRVLIGAPELHHWHHDLDRRAGNYANISPIMDKLFGTYVCPPNEPDAFGIKEETSNTYLGQLIEPILPYRIWQSIKKYFN